MEPTWLFPSSDWQDALWTATTVFLGLAGLQVLLWPFSPDPLEWVEVLEAALLGLWVGLVSWAGPHVRRLLQPVSPQQLRVTLTALLITVGFFGMGMIMSIGEAGAFLANGLLWLGLFLPLGFVLAVIGASRKKSGYPVEST